MSILKQNNYEVSSDEVCTKIISEIRNRLIDPLTVVQSIAESASETDAIVPKIVNDFEKTSKKIWQDIKKEIGMLRK